MGPRVSVRVVPNMEALPCLQIIHKVCSDTIYIRCVGDEECSPLSMCMQILIIQLIYVTRSRKRGPFPQKSDCELDLSVDSAKSIVHTCENRLMLACRVPKLRSFEYHTRAYLGFEAFISVL